MARGKKSKTWSQVALENAGFREGLRAFEFVINWGWATAYLGHEPTMDEFAEAAGISRATAFRDQQAFRKAFPMLDGPAEFNERTGQQKNYDDAARAVRDIAAARRGLMANVFTLGAMPADL